ncbi:hypothetical protein AMATHDRAFT_52138 [Amanita thiersii Skay4041]|uniref:Uncharacterized protein n=1 Tax=Amanita thiersii Skay4041 TaxID=703135 RepID=A0A2A9NY83_9AGAR|nr:hypothetical protein AMATHDRAFT_52138 [Amanita thiersii Skay4041]
MSSTPLVDGRKARGTLASLMDSRKSDVVAGGELGKDEKKFSKEEEVAGRLLISGDSKKGGE